MKRDLTLFVFTGVSERLTIVDFCTGSKMPIRSKVAQSKRLDYCVLYPSYTCFNF